MEAPVMTVAWKNPVPPVDLPKHNCCICGKEGSWIPGYRFPVGDGYGGYEFYFGVCSDHCDHIAKTNKLLLKAKIELNRSFYAGKKMPKFIHDLILKWEDEYANAAIVY